MHSLVHLHPSPQDVRDSPSLVSEVGPLLTLDGDGSSSYREFVLWSHHWTPPPPEQDIDPSGISTGQTKPLLRIKNRKRRKLYCFKTKTKKKKNSQISTMKTFTVEQNRHDSAFIHSLNSKHVGPRPPFGTICTTFVVLSWGGPLRLRTRCSQSRPEGGP